MANPGRKTGSCQPTAGPESSGAGRSLNLKRPATRLPWLDGLGSSRAMPGEYDTELSEITTSSASSGKVARIPTRSISTPDVNIVDVGSRRAVTRPSIGSLPEPPGSFDHTTSGEYTPSAYSARSRFDRETESQNSLPKKGPASYEKLVERPFDMEPHFVPARSSTAAFSDQNTTAAALPISSQVGDSGMVSLRKRQSLTDGNLSSDVPSSRKQPHPRTRRVVSDAEAVMNAARSGVGYPRSKSMQVAVRDLQGLMEEALRLVDDAEKRDRTDQVTAVLEEATVALRKASRVSGDIRSPLALSDIELATTSEDYTADSSSDISTESNSSSLGHRPRSSNETVPTEFSGSFQSIKNGPTSSATATVPVKVLTSEELKLSVPQSSTILSDSDVSPSTLPDSKNKGLGLPHSLQRRSAPPSADSIIIDFAYIERNAGHAAADEAVPKGKRPHRHQPRHKTEMFREDVDARPEDVDQAPVLIQTSEERRPKHLRTLDPVPITEPIDSGSYGPSKRKPRKRGLLRYPDRDVEETVLQDATSNAPKTSTIPVTAPVSASTTPSTGVKEAVLPSRPSIDVGLAKREENRKLKYKRRPIAREWNMLRKRITAVIACINTALVGLIAGIYAGEVPKIQYQLADTNHRVILGNVFFFLGLGITTLLAWPLPLLHGRKPYILTALAVTLPLQFPQSISVSQFRSPDRRWYVALLLPRAFSGIALGFANVNFLATLFDLFGASLQSHRPHQEYVDHDDIRRQGGGVGLWLGLWAWCFVGSLAAGFLIGAGVTARLAPAWGFYFVVILLAIFLLMNIVAPETRRAPHRRSILHYFDEEDNLQRKIARGEVKLHLNQQGPKYWWEEVWAGVRLMKYMMGQLGFAILALYLAWIYALVVLVTLLLGALLSTNYLWPPQYVGLGVFALALGALLAVPLSKANLLSRDRIEPARTDSMTFQPRVTWSSHLVRRCIFTFTLPIAGLAFTLTSPGPSVSWAAPTVMSATVGFLSTLAVAECVGLTMETFDTCDLQPGVNSKHRAQSLDSVTRRRRTNYSSFPRVNAGLFASQGLGFFLAAAATGVSGRITRALGAQAATGVVAGILLFLTILLSAVLWRFRTVQVIPNYALGTKKGSKDWTAEDDDRYWKAVIVGNPSGKVRRMNLLETGKWSRWTEIRRLNKLVKPGTWEVK